MKTNPLQEIQMAVTSRYCSCKCHFGQDIKHFVPCCPPPDERTDDDDPDYEANRW
jgi:hypothetical protein